MATDKELAAELKLAKTKPMNFAFVAHGNEGKLLVGKTKVSPKVAADAKKELGGGTIYQGRVHGEGALMVFEVAKEPPGTLAALTKKIIRRDAELMLDVEYRVAADLEGHSEETESTEGAESGQAPPVTVPPPPPPPDGDAAARFAARLKALAPVMHKLEGANSAAVPQVHAQMAEANKAFLGKSYADAHAALDRTEALIKQALGSIVKPPAKEPPPAFSVMNLGKARIEWINARRKAAQDIQRLQAALTERYKNDPAEKATLEAAVEELDSIFTRLDEELADQLDAVVNANADARSGPARAARATVLLYRDFIQSDDLMKLLDGNEVLPDMKVSAPLLARLEDITTALK